MASDVHPGLTRTAPQQIAEMTVANKLSSDSQIPDQPDLSIIIVNWNSAAFLRKCLQSIYANTHGISFEVVVVDNASFDGSDDLVQRQFPQVRFIQSQENLGFARANNRAFKHARGRNLLFLNPDTEIVGRALNVMLSSLNSAPDAGAIGCKLLNSDLSVQTNCIQPYPTILNQALNAEALRNKFPKWRMWGMQALFDGKQGLAEVEVVSGACLMTRRDVFENVEGFTADYFMYTEDIDFCFKVARAGWKNLYSGEATVIHHGGGSTDAKSKSHFAVLLMRESILKFFRLRRGRIYTAAYRGALAGAALVRLIVLGGLLVLPAAPARRESLRASFAKWRKLLRWSVGLETWVKQPTGTQAS